MITWRLETVQIKDLKKHPRNPRQISKHRFHHLKDLIDKYGMIDKPILNEDLTIIGGHQRVEALKLKKIKEVQCWLPSRMLDEKEVDELCIGLNLHQGEFDYDVLGNEWDVLELLEFGFTEDQLGFDKDTGVSLPSEEEEQEKKCEACGQKIKKKGTKKE